MKFSQHGSYFRGKFQGPLQYYFRENYKRYTLPSTPLSKDKGLKYIGHNISIGNRILGVNSATVSYLICVDSLLHNATDIIAKCDSYFITKGSRSLLQNSSSFFYKIRQFYHKMRQSLQIVTVQSITFFTTLFGRITPGTQIHI